MEVLPRDGMQRFMWRCSGERRFRGVLLPIMSDEDSRYLYFVEQPRISSGCRNQSNADGLSFGQSNPRNILTLLIKETSVVSFVGAADLYVAFNYIGTNSYEFMVPYLVMALIYIALILVVTLLVKLLERSLKKSDRRN